MEEKESQRKTLIFTSTKRTADEITRFLRHDGFPALAIHGDKQQSERDWVLSQFRSGGHPIMVATDVASRGIGKSLQLHDKETIGAEMRCSPKGSPMCMPLRSRVAEEDLYSFYCNDPFGIPFRQAYRELSSMRVIRSMLLHGWGSL